MNKSAKAKEMTAGGCVLLIIAGILFLSATSSDTTGILLPIGIIFILGGIVGLAAIIIQAFK